MVQPYLASQPRLTTQVHPLIDYKRLLRWLAQLQGSEIELGGFRGRTNKLVDGCYSWWVGGCFALLASQGIGGVSHAHVGASETTTQVHTDAEWDDVDGESHPPVGGMRTDGRTIESLWDKAALQRFILCAAQHPAAGLRDKPPKYCSM